MKENKAKKPVMSTLQNIKSDNLVIDFESMLVPGSILIGALMISLSIIFSFRGANVGSVKTDTGTGTDTTQNGDTGTLTPDTNDGTVASVSIDDDPYKGDKNKAKVAVIEFSDYECPFCKRHFTDVYPKLMENFVNKGEVLYVFRDLPLSFHEPTATLDAMAAQCVFDQKGNTGYFSMHDAIFKKTESNATNMNKDILVDLAKGVKGVNVNTFTKCLDDQKFAEEIKKDAADAAAAGIQGTPGFIIGKLESDGTVKDGTFLGGAYPYENFESAIKKYLN